jgi:hypothetical protein
VATDPPRAIKAAKFSALLNGQYHADREAHLDWWHRLFMFAVILLGASAVIDVLPQWARVTASIGTAAIGAADLLFDLSVRARNASFLRKSYFEIAAALEEGGIQPDKAEADMLRLAAEEEPPYKAAHALAENWATCAVYGGDEPLPCSVSTWRRLTRNVLHHAGHSFSVNVNPS